MTFARRHFIALALAAASLTPAFAQDRKELVIGATAGPYADQVKLGIKPILEKKGYKVRVVEFNARFGDPETQVVLDRLATPLGGLLHACAQGDLASAPTLDWLPGAAVTVVIAAEGYPADPVHGDRIDGIDAAGHVPGAYALQAGTAIDADNRLVVTGGRVLDIVGSGPDLATARASAYQAADLIRLRDLLQPKGPNHAE